jgi:hypothetical protein
VPRPRWLIGKRGITFNDRGRGLRLVHETMRYALFRQGMLAMAGAPIRAFVCSREGPEAAPRVTHLDAEIAQAFRLAEAG